MKARLNIGRAFLLTIITKTKVILETTGRKRKISYYAYGVNTAFYREIVGGFRAC